MIAKYNHNAYIANLKDEHVVLVTYQKKKQPKVLHKKEIIIKRK